MWNLEFLKALAERVLATMIQVAIPLLAAASLDAIDWQAAGLVVLSAGVLSILKGVLAGLVGSGSPSLTDAEVLPQPVTP